jgi:uncharacterized protein with GYD domain
MPKYMFTLRYTPEGLNSLRTSGAVARRTMGESIFASVGGTQESYYFAFGDYDACVIGDLPDDEAAVAVSITVNSVGLGVLSTTKLLTAEQVDAAFGRTVDYRPPAT